MTGSQTIEEQGRVLSLAADPVEGATLGAKAANLALARSRGLPVVDGFVIRPPLATALLGAPGGERSAATETVRAAWGSLSRRGSAAVVVRSSSATEDTERSSQAGVFESVVGVLGWDDFLDAVRTVAGSAERAPAGAASAPLAILVQRHVDAQLSGVLFTVDPLAGRSDRLAVAVVEGGPQDLVSGAVSGTRLVLDRHARIVEVSGRGQPLRWRHRVALVRLARQAEALFGGPQDIEWAIDDAGRLLLLQSRPITTRAAPVTGPVFGPGPVAETFPEPLTPLERDLWLGPLRDALRVVLALTGSATRRALARSPILIDVDGRAAVDLDLLDSGRRRRRRLALLDPRPPARRLRVAWQIGRLRSGLPALCGDITTAIDRQLAAVPPLAALTDEQLLLLLERSRHALRAAHGYELLAGMLAPGGGPSGAAVALVQLARGRRAGATDAEIVATTPIVLTLAAPAIGPEVTLPASGTDHEAAASTGVTASEPLGPREALRVRIRWLHELGARAAWELGARLHESGQLGRRGDVARADLAGLTDAVSSGAPVAVGAPPGAGGPALPGRFRLAADGSVVAVPGAESRSDGTAAGGGRGRGPVSHGPDPAPGSVLVVDTLDPRLAPVLPALAGLVSTTGSPLSHLAILAREHGIPTVVDVADAPRRFPPGTELLVDGTTGEVRPLTAPAPPRAGDR